MGLVSQHAKAPPEPFARSTPAAIFGSARRQPQAQMLLPRAPSLIMVSVAWAGAGPIVRHAGGAAEIRKMKSRPHLLCRRDFCLFGYPHVNRRYQASGEGVAGMPIPLRKDR
jgi:hypothetical protein